MCGVQSELSIKKKKNQRWEECWWERNMMRFRALAPSFCSTHTNQYMYIKGTSADFDSICHIHIHMHDGDLVSFSIRSLSHRIRSHTLAYIVHHQPNQHSTHILTRRTIMHEYCIETESLDSQSHAHKHSGTVIVDDRFVFILFIAWSFAMNAIHLARTKYFVHLDQQIFVLFIGNDQLTCREFKVSVDFKWMPMWAASVLHLYSLCNSI